MELPGSERESLQIIELMLRPGPGRCVDIDIAYAVVASRLELHGIAALDE
jgi:hypothetical protein